MGGSLKSGRNNKPLKLAKFTCIQVIHVHCRKFAKYEYMEILVIPFNAKFIECVMVLENVCWRVTTSPQSGI